MGKFTPPERGTPLWHAHLWTAGARLARSSGGTVTPIAWCEAQGNLSAEEVNTIVSGYEAEMEANPKHVPGRRFPRRGGWR